MRIRCKYRLTPDAEWATFHTDLVVWTAWEDELRRKVSDGLGLGVKDWIFWLFAYLRDLGVVPPEKQFADWVRENRSAECIPTDDGTDPNPTDGAPTDAS